MSDPMIDLFDWTARIVVRFHDAYEEEQNIVERWLVSLTEGPTDPDPTQQSLREESARRAFEMAVLSEPLPQGVRCALRGLNNLKAGREHPAKQTDIPSADFQDAPGAVEALRSLLDSSNSPIRNHFQEPLDSTDGGVNADA